MKVPRGMVTVFGALAVLSGLGLGALLALLARSHLAAATTTTTTITPRVARALVPPTPLRHVDVAALPASTAATTPTRTAVWTATPLHALSPTATPLRTVAPTATPTMQSTAAAVSSGNWRINEANVQVGTIVWVGNAISRGSELIFDLHKESVAGRPAMPCERETNLHIVLAKNEAPQTAPYHEVNCQGSASSGIIRVSALPSNGSFTGSFWDGARKLGDFNANQQ